MLVASLLTTAFLLAGTSASRILRNVHGPGTERVLRTGVLLAAVLAPLQVLLGDLHGLNTLEHQPAKIAAIEGIWETQAGAPLTLLGIPDEDAGRTRFAVEIPRAASLILTHSGDGVLQGLEDFPEHPPVLPVFVSFRVMVGIGVAMLARRLVVRLLRRARPRAAARRAAGTRAADVRGLGSRARGLVRDRDRPAAVDRLRRARRRGRRRRSLAGRHARHAAGVRAACTPRCWPPTSRRCGTCRPSRRHRCKCAPPSARSRAAADGRRSAAARVHGRDGLEPAALRDPRRLRLRDRHAAAVRERRGEGRHDRGDRPVLGRQRDLARARRRCVADRVPGRPRARAVVAVLAGDDHADRLDSARRVVRFPRQGRCTPEASLESRVRGGLADRGVGAGLDARQLRDGARDATDQHRVRGTDRRHATGVVPRARRGLAARENRGCAVRSRRGAGGARPCCRWGSRCSRSRSRRRS